MRELLSRLQVPAAPALLLACLLAAMPAAAQQQTQEARQEAGDQDEPVEIISDSLQVDQERQLATFTGNVDAVQGDLRLRADKLLVYYEEGGGSAGQQGGDQGIRRLEAVGNVFLTRPGETAKGDRGTYQPATGEVTMDGNVVLTRGQNVIRGARLVSNRRSGQSTVFAAQPGAGGKPEQRVRALFRSEGGRAQPQASRARP